MGDGDNNDEVHNYLCFTQQMYGHGIYVLHMHAILLMCVGLGNDSMFIVCVLCANSLNVLNMGTHARQ